MENRQKIGPKRTHHAAYGHPMVTPRSPHGHPECLSVVIYHRFDPYKLGVCASLGHILSDPRPLSVCFWRTLDPYGGTWGKAHVYIGQRISDPKLSLTPYPR